MSAAINSTFPNWSRFRSYHTCQSLLCGLRGGDPLICSAAGWSPGTQCQPHQWHHSAHAGKLQQLRVALSIRQPPHWQYPFRSELGTMTYLTVLSLSDNNLTGSIPFSLANLVHCSILHLDHNHLPPYTSSPVPTRHLEPASPTTITIYPALFRTLLWQAKLPAFPFQSLAMPAKQL